jgi:cathepsin L
MISAFFASAQSCAHQEEKSFVDWMRSTNNMYVGDEYHFRLGLFAANKRKVREHNAHSSYTVEMNQFATLTESEYKAMLGHRPSTPIAEIIQSNKKAPSEVDWREKGIVNPVFNQGSCGSCWAFSVVFAQESAWKLHHGDLPILAEQNLVDCVTTCSGCNGGMEDLAYKYIIEKQGGLWMYEKDYPYTARDGTCKFDKTKGVCPTKSFFAPCEQGNEQQLVEGCAEKGCVSIAIDAGNWDFQMYKSGVYDPTSCKSGYYQLNHAVGLVGYGVDGKDFWIVRNSWGATWGENGYIRMVRNKSNKCGVATDAIIPVV